MKDDAISRRGAIKAIKDALLSWSNMPEWRENKMVGALDKLPPAQPGWIPCKERLPKEDGNYLVTFEEGYAADYGFDSIGIAPFEVDCEGFGIWQEEFDRHTLGSLGSDWVEIKVIAWMPLPEPWKGEEHDTSRAVLSQKPVR